MKKLMIAAAIVCAAAMSQAASLAWSSAGYYWDPATNAKGDITGGSVVLCIINDGADWTKGVTVVDTGVLTSGSTMAAANGKVAGSNGGKYGFTYGAAGTIKNDDVLTVLFKDSAGTYSQLHYVDADGKITDTLVTDTYTVANLSSDSSVLTAFTFGKDGTKNITAQAVPEPTSGLLLLLGIGAMALRRRRA